METVKERALTAIENRSDLSQPTITVYNLLKAVKVESWAGLCCSRIADANLIDMEDIIIDFLNPPGLCLTADGVRICRNILESYIDKEMLCNVFEWMRSEKSINEDVNTAVQVLRNMSGPRLRKLYREADSLQIPESINARELISEEIRQRSPLSGVFRKIRKEYRLLPIRWILSKSKKNVICSRGDL